MRRSLFLGLAATAVFAVAGAALAGDLQWKLGFSNDTPTWVKTTKGQNRTAIEWYMLYSVENATGAARNPSLRIELHTDNEKVYRDTGSPVLRKAVEKSLRTKDLKTIHDLRKGIDDGKTVKGIATFGPLDVMADTFELRVYGLKDPVHKVDGKVYREVSYWMAKWRRSGDEFDRTKDEWKLVEEKWVTESKDEVAQQPVVE